MVQLLFSTFGLAWFTATTRLDTPKCDHSIGLLSHVLYTVAMDKILTNQIGEKFDKYIIDKCQCIYSFNCQLDHHAYCTHATSSIYVSIIYSYVARNLNIDIHVHCKHKSAISSLGSHRVCASMVKRT